MSIQHPEKAVIHSVARIHGEMRRMGSIKETGTVGGIHRRGCSKERPTGQRSFPEPDHQENPERNLDFTLKANPAIFPRLLWHLLRKALKVHRHKKARILELSGGGKVCEPLYKTSGRCKTWFLMSSNI